jgi:hypothetical protein
MKSMTPHDITGLESVKFSSLNYIYKMTIALS